MGWRGDAGAAVARWNGPEQLRALRIDPGNASVRFEATLLGLFHVRGSFREFEGLLQSEDGDPRRATLEARISAASLYTGVALRDHHLRGREYLDAMDYPDITFRSRSVVLRPPHLVVGGVVTLRGIASEQELACVSRSDPRAEQGAWTLSSCMTLSRSRFGIGRASPRLGWLDPRPYAIGDRVRVLVDVRLAPA